MELGENMSQQVIDISSLLQPISADLRAGGDLRADTSPTSLYAQIRDARKAARAAERTNLFDRSNPEADENWRKVADLAPKALRERSKDLEVAAWYTESLIRRHGFAGARDGFTLIRGLIEEFWDGLYPLPDEDGIATRVASLTGLNGEGAEGVLIAPIRTAFITESGPDGAFAYWQYKQAVETQRISDDAARGDQIAKNGFSLDDILKSVEESTPEFYVRLRDDVAGALEEYKRVGDILLEKCGASDAPPTSNIVTILGDVLGAINHIAKHKLPAAESIATDGVEGNGAGEAVSFTGSIKTRHEAFQQLSQISQFFRRTEPHSPVSYIIEKAVRWGNMSLSELMDELIPDSNSRTTYSSLTGVTPGNPEQ